MKYIITLFFSFSIHLSIAQSLNELSQQLVNQSLELQAIENSYRADLERATQVSQLPQPELGVGTFPLPVETRLGAQVLRLSGTQLLPFPGTLKAKAALENWKAQISYEQLTAQEWEQLYRLQKAYFQLYNMEQQQQIIQKNVELMESMEQVALAKVSSGQSVASEAIRLQLRRRQLEQQIVILRLEMQKYVSEINELLNRNVQTPIVPTDSLSFAVLPFRQQEIVAQIEATHPSLRQYELRQKAAQQAITINDLQAKPTFGFGADYIAVNDRSDANPMRNGRDILQVRAMLMLPLYRKGYAAKKREEELRIAALNQQQKATFNQFITIVEQAFISYEQARLTYEFYEEQSELVAASLQIAEAQYSSSQAGFEALLELEMEQLAIELKRLESIVNSHLAVAEIGRLTDF